MWFYDQDSKLCKMRACFSDGFNDEKECLKTCKKWQLTTRWAIKYLTIIFKTLVR